MAQGEALYNDGDYAAALAEFEEAYRSWPRPSMWNNIGLAQRGLFRYTDAIESLQKFLDQAQNLTPDRRAQTEQIIAEIKALLADVTIAITPAGATITLDGRAAGAAPLAKPIAIAAGSHSIEVAADGYASQKKDIIVAAGKPLALSFALVRIPRTGKVHIASTTSHARVAVDGHDAGPAPVDVELTGGGHSVEVSAPHYTTRHDEVVVTVGQSRDLSISLDRTEPPKSWYQKWYVVTPIALLVVGVGTGLAINYGTHQAPIDGTLGVVPAR